MSKDTLNFRTSSGIKSIVGRDLITDKFVAIFELVKNSYDANAKNVIVSFNNLEHQNKEDLLDQDQTASLYKLGEYEPHLVIKDDGKGMNKEDLENKWLFLAYSEKKDKEGSDNEGRSLVGSKGVGRFSCDTLGGKLILKTKKSNEHLEHQIFINWNQFEENQTIEFNDIEVKYQAVQKQSDEHYTELIIRDLRNIDWQLASEQNKAKKALEKLKNPFKEDDGFNIYIGKNISYHTELNSNYSIKNKISKVLKNRTTTIELISDHKDIELELFDRGEVIFKLKRPNDTILSSTPMVISIHYLNRSAKIMFKKLMDIEPVNYGSIFIYRNNFRVMPYGESWTDLFNLNTRKSQGYSRYLGTRELLGYFEIQDKNNLFKETSSRNNGFIQNIYTNALEGFYMDFVHRILERYIYLIQWGENIQTEKEIFFDPQHSELTNFKRYIQSKGYSIEYFKESIDDDIRNANTEKELDKLIAETEDQETKQIASKVRKQLKNLKSETRQQSKTIQEKEQKEQNLERQVRNLSLERRDESTFGEQITHHFVGMGEKLRFATNNIMPFINHMNETHQELALKEINRIRCVQQELIIFKDLLLKTNIDLRSDQLVNWYEQALWFIKEKSALTKRIKFSCVNHGQNTNNWNIVCNTIGLQMMFENFYQNSRDHKATYINIEFYNDRLKIENNSGPISDNDINKITELGYSTKQNGTGIGLHQINEFVEKYGFYLTIKSTDITVIFEITKKDN